MNSYKVVLFGRSNIGKSSLVIRWKDGIFHHNSDPTIGAAFVAKNISSLNQKTGFSETILLEIWDTAGQERYRSLTPMYLRGANIVLLCIEQFNMYNQVNIDTLIRETKNQIKAIQISAETAKIMLVATKIDTDERRLALLEFEAFAKENNLSLYYTSALVGSGIDELFMKISDDCINSEIVPIIRQNSIYKKKLNNSICCST